MKLTSFGRLPRYALVLAGGAIEGQRPRSALFELFGIRPDGDYQGRRVGAKSRRRVKAAEVLTIWRGHPSTQQIAEVRKRLPQITSVPGRATDAVREAMQERAS
jgi:hypothetical protein